MGLLNYSEIKDILRFIKKNKFPMKKVFLLHCVSDYPVEDKEANLISVKSKFCTESLILR